jgi:hypothetical protein
MLARLSGLFLFLTSRDEKLNYEFVFIRLDTVLTHHFAEQLLDLLVFDPKM